jgi:hypothetical protein
VHREAAEVPDRAELAALVLAAEAVRGAKVAVEVRVLDGINHMGIVAAPKAVSIIAEDVATRAMAGS